MVLLFQHSLHYRVWKFSCYFYVGSKLFRICYSSIISLTWLISVILSKNFRYFWIIITKFYQIIHQYHNIKISCIIYLDVLHFAYAVSEWYTIFKYYLFISFVCLSCCCTSSFSCNFSLSFSQVYMLYIRCSLKFHLAIGVIHSTRVIIYFNPVFVLFLDTWFGVLSKIIVWLYQY